jgi:hypothetical protein
MLRESTELQMSVGANITQCWLKLASHEFDQSCLAPVQKIKRK